MRTTADASGVVRSVRPSGLAAFILIALGCTPIASPPAPATPAPTAVESVPSLQQSLPAGVPADCDRPTVRLEFGQLPSVPTAPSDAVRQTDLYGYRPAPVAVVLARASWAGQDVHGVFVSRRPVWLVYRTGLMNSLPSGGVYLKDASPRPTVTLSTAIVSIVDAVSGEGLMEIGCGLIEVFRT